MKLRIFDDSVRLRLTRSEVAEVARGTPVEASTRFPGGEVFRYVLVVADVPEVTARMAAGRIEVTLPRAAAIEWATSENVSIRNAVSGASGTFEVLVEKDFACLDPREGEDAADLYPNPKAR